MTPRYLGIATGVGVALLPALALAVGAGEHHAPDHVPVSVYFHVVNLTILVGLLIYFLRAPVREYLAKRKDEVRDALLAAKKAQEEAEARAADLKARLASLESEAANHRSEQIKEAKIEGERIIAAAHARASAMEAQVARTLEDELRRVKTDLRREVVDMAMDLAKEMVKSGISSEDHTRLYGEYVTHLNNTEVN